jgi:competence protein ComEA
MVLITRGRLLILSIPLAALLLLAGQRVLRGDRPDGPSPATAVAVEGAGAARDGIEAETAKVVVHVSGAIERPGLYTLPEGSRVADAVRRAGGLKPRADLSVVNLAAPIADGQHVVVVRRLSLEAGATASTAAAASGAKVQLSSATLEELDGLPGIGPVTAQKIVDWRAANGPFSSVDDLDEIPGIGPARVEQLRDLVVP